MSNVTESLLESHVKTVNMVREHIANATDEEIGRRVRAIADAGVETIEIRNKPRWMERDTFLPDGEIERHGG